MIKHNMAKFGKAHFLPQFSLRWYILGHTYRGILYSGCDTKADYPLHKRHFHMFDSVAYPYERAALESSHRCYLYNNYLGRLWRWR